jgi:MATE family multidrug resistance protein
VQLVLMAGIPLICTEIVLSQYLHLFGLPISLAETVHRYIWTCAPAMLFFHLFLVGRAYLQSVQRTLPIVIAAVLANVLNLASDILLVFGDRALKWLGIAPIGLPPLGALGAGITTTLSAAALCVLIWRSVRQDICARTIKANSDDESDTTTRGRVFALAWPIGCQQVAESWMFCLFGVLVGRFGETAAAGYQTALTLAAAAFMLALGLSSATSVRVGHAVGQGSQPDIRRAAMAGTLLVLIVMGSTATLFILQPLALISLMTNQIAVVEVAVPLLSYAAAFALFDGVQVVMAGALRGIGDVRIPFVLGLMSYWAVGGVVAWYGMMNYEVKGIWFGLTAGLMASSLLLSLRWFAVTRRTIKTIA